LARTIIAATMVWHRHPAPTTDMPPDRHMAAMGHPARWVHLHLQAAVQHWAQATSICRKVLLALLLAGEPEVACHQGPWVTCHHSRHTDEVGTPLGVQAAILCHSPVTQPARHLEAWGTCHHTRTVQHSQVTPLAMELDHLGNNHRAPHHPAILVAAVAIIMALMRRRTCQPNHQIRESSLKGHVAQIQRLPNVWLPTSQKAHPVTSSPRRWTGYLHLQRHEGHHQLTAQWGQLIVQWRMASRIALISWVLANNRRESS